MVGVSRGGEPAHKEDDKGGNGVKRWHLILISLSFMLGGAVLGAATRDKMGDCGTSSPPTLQFLLVFSILIIGVILMCLALILPERSPPKEEKGLPEPIIFGTDYT